MQYSWLLFDADGTLFDYDKAEGKALAATFQNRQIPFDDAYTSIYREINAQLWVDFERGKISQKALRSARFARLFAAIDVAADPHAFSDAYLINLGNVTDLIDGALELVHALVGSYRLLLITNGIPEVQHSRLAQSPLGDCFEAVIISGELGVAKPDPAIFDAAFEAMGQPAKKEALIIGDSLTSDIQGGINYGIDTCWFNPQNKPAPAGLAASYQINSLSELLTIIGQHP